MLQKSLESQEALARAEQNKLVSEFTGKKQQHTRKEAYKWSFHPDAKNMPKLACS